MAEQITLVPFITPPTQVAAADFTQRQYNVVQVNNTLTAIADERSHSAAYVLETPVRSGAPVSLSGPPNVARCIAAEAITGGTWVKVFSATGLVGVSSQGGFGRVGAALQGTVSGSGDMIAVKLAH